MVLFTSDNTTNVNMLGTQSNEEEVLSRADEILGDESAANTNDAVNQDVDGVVEDEDDDRSSDDEDDQDDDDDEDDEDDLEDDDDDLDEVVPSKSILCKTKNSTPSNGGMVGAGLTAARGPSSSQLSQHRKHHHRRLATRPAVTVGVKVGSSRGLTASKVGLRARKATSASCLSPACGAITSSDEEYEEEVLMEGEVEELDRESDDEDEDDIGPPDFLLPGEGDPGGIQGIPPDAQARLEAFFEAAGFTDGRLMSDPESLRKLTMTVSSALGEASAAINRMRDSQRYDETSRRKSLEEGRSDSMEEGDSLLALACSSGYFELARVLLAMGANVDDRGSKGDLTPLMDAASQGHVEIVRLLINHGAEVNAQSACGNSPLMYACAAGHEDIVKELLKSGANVEDNNENGHTPLMEAASAGHVGVAKILLEHGAGINTHSNEFKESALTVACYKGHLDMVKFLLEAGADQQHKTDEMHTALMEASMDGHVEVAKLLLDSGAQVNMPADSFESPLTLAACGGHVELAELLIERGAKIEEVNDEGYTPLMEAAREGHLAVVQCLLQNGAAINSQTEETHETALTLAACGGFLDVVDMLLKSGADIELGASTPLMEAAQEGHIAVVKYLLERKADIRRQTQTGDTALSYACENGHLDVAELLVGVGAEVEHCSEGGRTPLMKACRGGHLDVIKFLVLKGANVNRPTTSNDHTPLSLACAGGHVACVEALLAAQANPFHKLKDNSTMIIEAARGGHASVMKILLDFVPANQTRSRASDNAGAAGNAKNQAAGPAGKTAVGQKTSDQNKPGAVGNQNQAKNSVLRKSRSTSTLDPTPAPQPSKETGQGKVDTQPEDDEAKKMTAKSLSNDAQSQKNLNASQASGDAHQKQVGKPGPASTLEKKGAGNATSANVCSECGATEGAIHHGHGHETPPTSTGQTSVKRSVRTEPVLPTGTPTQTTAAPTTPLTPTGPPLVPSQVTAATAISERPKAKPSKPSARKLQQGGLSPGSDNGQGSPNGSVSSSSSGVSPVAISSASALPGPGTPKTSQQLPNCAPASVSTSTSVQMQIQPGKTGVSVATSAPGSSQIKLDSKQLSQLFVQHQQNMKNKSGSVQPTGADPSTSGMGHLGIGTPTTTTVVVHHGESDTIIQGDNLPPGTSDLIFNAAAQAFPLEGFPVQCGQITSPSGVHIQSYHQLSAPGTVPSIGVAPLSAIPGGLSGFQQPLLLQHPPPLPAAMTAAAAGAGLVPPSGAPPQGAFKGSNNLPSSKAKESQKSNMSQMVKTLSGTSNVQVQQPQTPVPPVATVAGIQTTKKNLAKRTRPFSNSSGGTQNRQSTQTQTHANSHGAHTKQNHAVASTQTNLTGQAADKMLKHLDLDCATESAGETGLSVAAASGHYEVVEFLLTRKAHMEHKDKKGCTPLILAADGGHDKIVELLLAHGAEIEAQSERTKDTALSLACTKGRYEVVEHLLKKGANKEHRNVSDYTPLSLAASGGYVNIIKLLLHHGAEINSRTGSKLGISPLMLAAMNGNTAAVKLLLDMGSDINAQIETNKNTALTLACFQGRQEVVSLLLDRKANLEHRAKTGLTPLMEAANGGYTEVGKILIDRGADVNAAPVPATKDTALTIAADKGHFRFVELLLQRGAMVEVRNKKGCTPLWLACHGGHSDVAQILFKHGADLDAQDNRRVSCLMAAYRKGHVKVIRWIVKNVQQFPSDGELTRFLSSIQNELDLHKKCKQCEEFIKQAKDKQAQEATRNANILLEELDMERSREESKKQAAARRREKKKKKKQEKKHGGASRDDDDDNDEDEQEEEDESVIVADSGIDANSLGSNSSNGVDPRGARKNNKENFQTSKQSLPEQIVPDVVNEIEQAASSMSKSRKKRNKKEKEKTPVPQETPVVDNASAKKISNKDILRENENRIAKEEEKLIEKVNAKSKDKRTKREVVETPQPPPQQIEPEKPPASKDSTTKPKKPTKVVHDTPVTSLPNHPEPLMGISVHPNVRKSAEGTSESNSSHFPSSPNSKTASASVSSALPIGKLGRKDDGWKEVTRSCPSSRSKKVIVPSSVISRVIGRGGCNINAIREATGAHIEVEKQQKGQLQPERIIQIKGSVDATKQAHSLITALMNEPDLDVKKLLPVIAQAQTGASSVWSMPLHATVSTVASQRVPTISQISSSVPASTPVDTNIFGGVSAKKSTAAKGGTSPVNLSSSPPVKKAMPPNGNVSATMKMSPGPLGKRSVAAFSSTSHSVSTASTTSFASKVVPQQSLTNSGNIQRDNSAHTTPTKTVTPTFTSGSPTPPPTAPSPSMTITANGGAAQMRSPNQGSVAPNLPQYGIRGMKDSTSEATGLGGKVYGGFVHQDNVPTSGLASSLSAPENGGLSAFARADVSQEERIERPSSQTVPLEYAPFKYQFSKTTTSSWYQDDFTQNSTTLTGQLGSPPSANMTHQSNSGLGPVGSTAGLTMNSHGGNMSANRSMNFASVAASGTGISSNSTTTSAPMSQTGGVQNGNLGSLGGLITMPSGNPKPLGDLFSDADLPKVDASKAPGYRGNNLNSPSHRVQQQPVGSGGPFGSDSMALPQFGGLMGSQGSQGLGYQNMGRQVNSVQNNPAYTNTNSGMGGIQQNTSDFMPRNLSPQSSNVMNFPNNSGGQQNAPSQSKSSTSTSGVATNVVLSSRLNPRAPSFNLPHSKVSAAIQPPSQQFNQPMHQQGFKLGNLGQFGSRNPAALPNPGRTIGGLNLGQNQGWSSYGDGSSSTEFQGLGSSGQQQSMDPPIMSGLESSYEPPGSVKMDDRRGQRAIGPIGAERSLKGNTMGSNVNAMGYGLSQDATDSVHLGLQQQQNQSMHLHQQHQSSSWGGMFGTSNPPLFPGPNQHHQQLPQLGNVAPSPHLARGNPDIRPFTGNRFLEQVDQSRYLDFHQQQMYDGQRLMNGSAMPSMMHMPSNVQPNLFPFGMEHNEQQQHIPKAEHLSNSWGDAHLTDDNKSMAWSKWGN